MTSARERIIEATLALVAEQGLSEVTMVAVAKQAGVARATLYNHYPDVPSVLADAAELHNRYAIDSLRQALAVVSGPEAVLAQLVRHVGALSTHGHTLITHHGFPPDLRTRLGSFDAELDHQIHEVLIEGVALGRFRSGLDVDINAGLVRHALVGVSELVAAGPDRAAAIADEAIRTLLRALGAPTDG